MVNLFGKKYFGKTILITGNSGFKGSWMAHWLIKMGANVIGMSKDTPSEPNHFKILKDNYTEYFETDITDIKNIEQVFLKHKIDLVFHLAAQSLVRYSYQNPLETFNTNIMGTANLLEVCKKYSSVKGVVVVTSDKCYENFEDDRPYNENDRMGGYDPYSASKGCAELVVSSYTSSFFSIENYGKTHSTIICSARAGNVIGGGDWSLDRLIPDVVKNTNTNLITEIRNPNATRPWQHVLEPLSGYLVLGQNILSENINVSGGWNFGPKNNETLPVSEVLKQSTAVWPKIKYQTPNTNNALHEAKLLRLDCTKANTKLNWYPVWNTQQAIEKTIVWYKNYYENFVLNTESDLEEYIKKAVELKYDWAK
ncbi:MAG: CDP-glucose 4,6-dehydratase [Bacteroidota bacterium]